MAALFLEDVDLESMQIIQAACLVRTATAPLLAAMLPHIPTDKALDRLRELPFVSAGPHGLVVHEAVRVPVTAALKSSDPARCQAYRRAASQVVRDQYRQAPRSDYWRCTADVLYLLENENLREGFFPTIEGPISVEPARADDETAISEIIHRFDGPESRQALEQWLHYHPDSFFVVRDEHGAVQGFYQAIVAATLWLRRTLDSDTGEGPSAGQGLLARHQTYLFGTASAAALGLYLLLRRGVVSSFLRAIGIPLGG